VSIKKINTLLHATVGKLKIEEQSIYEKKTTQHLLPRGNVYLGNKTGEKIQPG